MPCGIASSPERGSFCPVDVRSVLFNKSRYFPL